MPYQIQETNTCLLNKHMKDSFNFKDWKTIVLTPWFWCFPHVMSLLWKELQEHFNVVYSPTLRNINTVSIKISAKDLQEKLAKILRYTHDGDISLVWHSMGGLISIEALKMAFWMKINSILTMWTPFGGTPLANVCSPFLKSCQEINTSGGYLKEVSIGEQLNGSLIAHTSWMDIVVPEVSQEPHETLAQWKTQIVRHKHFQHQSFLIWEWCREMVKSIIETCK